MYYLIQGFIFVLVWTGILFGVSPLAPTWLLITLAVIALLSVGGFVGGFILTVNKTDDCLH